MPQDFNSIPLFIFIFHFKHITISQLDYVFYGLHKLDVRCRSFFDQMQEMFPNFPEFQGESDERTICARDCLEQYVMQRIGEYAFKSTVDTEADNLLLRRMRLLSFLTPEVR